jgi:hypothetical protein
MATERQSARSRSRRSSSPRPAQDDESGPVLGASDEYTAASAVLGMDVLTLTREFGPVRAIDVGKGLTRSWPPPRRLTLGLLAVLTDPEVIEANGESGLDGRVATVAVDLFTRAIASLDARIARPALLLFGQFVGSVSNQGPVFSWTRATLTRQADVRCRVSPPQQHEPKHGFFWASQLLNVGRRDDQLNPRGGAGVLRVFDRRAVGSRDRAPLPPGCCLPGDLRQPRRRSTPGDRGGRRAHVSRAQHRPSQCRAIGGSPRSRSPDSRGRSSPAPRARNGRPGRLTGGCRG